MKKLVCLLILITLIVGCSSNSSVKNKEEVKTSEKNEIEDKKQDEDKKEKDQVSIDDKVDDTKVAKDDETKNDIPSINSDTSVSNNNSNQASSGNSNGSSNSNTGGSSTSPKQETPTTPKVETPPPPQPPVPATPTEQRGKADTVMAQINAYRQQNGKPSFLITNYLLENSKKHAYAMAEKRALWHSGAAECITNYDDPFSAWVNSPEHNKLLLSNNETGAVSIYYVDGYYFSVFQTLP